MLLHRRLLAAATVGLAAALATTGLAAPSDGAAPSDPGHRSAVAAAPSGIHVSGNQVRRNDYRFTSRGVIFEGFQFPLEAMQQCVSQQTGAAKDFCQRHVDAQNYYFGDALDRAATNWHANTVRLNLVQVMLDPESALYKKKNADGSTWGATYLARVEQAVSFARQKNLVVELALFNYRLAPAEAVKVDGKGLNDYDPKSGLPTYRTNRALKRLATAFKGQDEVLLEPYNEPFGNAGQYVNGHASGPKVAGINTLAATARAAGVKTPLIVQGPSADLSALPLSQIKDKNMIFSSHAFLSAPDADDAGDWARLFGSTAKTRPVLITAWGARAAHGNWCAKHSPNLAQQFLDYVEARSIGLDGFAFDVNGTIVKNFQTTQDAPTTFLPKSAPDRCASGGAGEKVQKLFAAYAGK